MSCGYFRFSQIFLPLGKLVYFHKYNIDKLSEHNMRKTRITMMSMILFKANETDDSNSEQLILPVK